MSSGLSSIQYLTSHARLRRVALTLFYPSAGADAGEMNACIKQAILLQANCDVEN